MMNDETGFTDEEQRVMDAIVLAFNEFSKIERQHPDELRDFTDGIHRFHSKFGQDHLATGGFSGGGVSGKIEHRKI